ncbi:transmembrane protein-like protein [Dinothrombium tinctorium]|uniref:Transmembrane protein-like protein n=1 Tax=Dinothrombium tinctorium TaxID=1965070 RepID=A0A3S3QZB5_9ACAR|nr:transmembrane protein-like protein [Dinothrombium tinctorium]
MNRGITNGGPLQPRLNSNHVYGYGSQQQPQQRFAGLEVGLEVVEENVIAFICGIIGIFLLTLCLASSHWLTTEKFRQGLWEFCVEKNAPRPLPFDLNVEPGCHWGRDVGYIKLAGIFCLFGLAFDFVATIMTGFGLCSKDPRMKYTLYRFALYVMVGALVVLLIALVIYPAQFAAEINESLRNEWEFGWAYGVGWGAAIFLFGSILLLLCDKETEEIYYKERTIIHNPSVNEIKA